MEKIEMSSLELEILHAGNYHYEHGCRGKIGYPDQDGAKRGARAMKRTFKKAFDAYHCGFCDSWHVGSRGRRPAA